MEKENLNLVSIGKKMEQFPEINTAGELVVKNYDIIIEELNFLKINFDENFKLEEPKNNLDFYKLYDIKKTIQLFQKHLKENFLKKLDNEKIEKIREKTNDLLKILGTRAGTTPGNISFLIEKYKSKEQNNIIECAFANVKENELYPANFDYFTAKCNDLFKGKSKFEEMQDLALVEADNYSKELELKFLKYQNFHKELLDNCKSIGFIPDDDFIDLETKKLVNNITTITESILRINFKAQIQKTEIERLEKERQSKIEAETKAKVETETKEIEKTYTLELKIIATGIQLFELKNFLQSKNIKFEKI